jgi:hypothetical protein
MKRNGDGADSVVPKTKRLGGTVLSARQKIANPSCRPASCLRTFWEGRIRDGGAVPMGNKKKKKCFGSNNQWYLGNIFEVWPCGNLKTLGVRDFRIN